KVIVSEIGISKRIGITKSINYPWRIYIKENKFLSRK
ncbi:MAG: DNA-3-methyladenine glycosylase, partial [Ignavibacteriae bacterium]